MNRARNRVEAHGALGAAAAEWAGTHRLQVGRWNVRYRKAGSGPPVVLVHGLGVSADYWVRNGPPIAAAGFQVFAPDLPGFGRTEGPKNGLTVPGQAAMVAAWAKAAGIGPATFIGHSLSAQSVLELAATWPERVDGLVLIAPTGAPGSARMVRQAWRLFVDLWREPWRLVTTVAVAYLRVGPRRYWNTWRAGAEHDPLPLLPLIGIPAMVVVGTRDPVVERGFAARIAAGLGDGRIVTIEGAAHAAQFDRAEEFNQVALEFLRQIDL